jgi:hypothetical protein
MLFAQPVQREHAQAEGGMLEDILCVLVPKYGAIKKSESM